MSSLVTGRRMGRQKTISLLLTRRRIAAAATTRYAWSPIYSEFWICIRIRYSHVGIRILPFSHKSVEQPEIMVAN
jgi:hypothetical protein